MMISLVGRLPDPCTKWYSPHQSDQSGRPSSRSLHKVVLASQVGSVRSAVFQILAQSGTRITSRISPVGRLPDPCTKWYSHHKSDQSGRPSSRYLHKVVLASQVGSVWSAVFQILAQSGTRITSRISLVGRLPYTCTKWYSHHKSDQSGRPSSRSLHKVVLASQVGSVWSAVFQILAQSGTRLTSRISLVGRLPDTCTKWYSHHKSEQSGRPSSRSLHKVVLASRVGSVLSAVFQILAQSGTSLTSQISLVGRLPDPCTKWYSHHKSDQSGWPSSRSLHKVVLASQVESVWSAVFQILAQSGTRITSRISLVGRLPDPCTKWYSHHKSDQSGRPSSRSLHKVVLASQVGSVWSAVFQILAQSGTRLTSQISLVGRLPDPCTKWYSHHKSDQSGRPSSRSLHKVVLASQVRSVWSAVFQILAQSGTRITSRISLVGRLPDPCTKWYSPHQSDQSGRPSSRSLHKVVLASQVGSVWSAVFQILAQSGTRLTSQISLVGRLPDPCTKWYSHHKSDQSGRPSSRYLHKVVLASQVGSVWSAVFQIRAQSGTRITSQISLVGRLPDPCTKC